MSITKNNPEYIYGTHAVKALLGKNPQQISALYLARKKNDAHLKEILELAAKNNITVKTITAREADLLLPKSNHQGIIAQISALESQAATYHENDLEVLLDNLDTPAFLLILDTIQDPHNLGAILRTANAAGVQAVIAPKDKSVGLTATVRKVACGAAETTPFIQVTNLARTLHKLQERGIWIYGADANAEMNIYQADFKGAIALTVGAEGSGLRRLTRETCDFLVAIPMAGDAQSLNVAVAAGVLLFEAKRKRQESD